MAYAKRRRQLVESDDGRVPSTLLKTADVLLGEPGEFRQFLLCQALSSLIRLTLRPTSSRISMRGRSADNAPLSYQL
jgi:hypothetical protein